MPKSYYKLNLPESNQKHITELNQSDFSEKVIVPKTPIVELNGIYPLTKLRDTVVIGSTGGTVISTKSEFQLKHQNPDEFSCLISSERGRYLPGYSALSDIGIRLDGRPKNGDIDLRWGLLDLKRDKDRNFINEIKDGIFFGEDPNGVYVDVIRGATSQLGKVYSKDWNVSPGHNIDTEMGNIFQVTYTYYGYGLIKWQVIEAHSGDERQRVKTLHSIRLDSQTLLEESNLKIGGFVDSSNSSDNLSMFIGGRQYQIYGEYDPNARINAEWNNGVSVSTSANSSWTHLISFRKKTDEQLEQVPIEFWGFDCETDQDIILDIRIDPDLSGGKWNEISTTQSNETSLEVNTGGTSVDVSTGVAIHIGFVKGGTKNKEDGILSRWDLPVSIPDESIISISAKAKSTDATVDIMARMREEF